MRANGPRSFAACWSLERARFHRPRKRSYRPMFEGGRIQARRDARFRDRHEAGQLLGRELARRLGTKDGVIVLALPRGGVPVGYEVAKALNAPLDVFIVRKL